MADSGYSAVHASPLRWHGTALGAMGMFRRAGSLFTPEEETVAQAFADLATLLIVQTADIDLDEVRQRVEEVLTSRVLIEQAKGVIAETRGVEMAEAYTTLLQLADQRGATLTSTAQTVLDEARTQRFT
jgi:electron transfer flavoprotein alpha subunit